MRGLFSIAQWEHPRIVEARDSGDMERVAALIKEFEQSPIPLRGYDLVRVVEAENMRTLEGRKFLLDLITAQESNTDLHWYFAPWTSDSTPADDWDGDFLKASGGKATEFTGYTASTRQECVFDAAVGTTIVRAWNSTRAQITISAGVSASIVGIGITNNNTKQYGSGSAVLLAAGRLASPMSVAAGAVYPLGYSLLA